MAAFSTDDRDGGGAGKLARYLVGLMAVAWGIVWAIWLDGALDLLFLGSTAVAATAVAMRVWRLRALDAVADLSPALAWMVPRLVLLVVALLAVSASRLGPSPLPDCPPAATIEHSGDLLYADLVNNTLVCEYRYTGSSL